MLLALAAACGPALVARAKMLGGCWCPCGEYCDEPVCGKVTARRGAWADWPREMSNGECDRKEGLMMFCMLLVG